MRQKVILWIGLLLLWGTYQGSFVQADWCSDECRVNRIMSPKSVLETFFCSGCRSRMLNPEPLLYCPVCSKKLGRCEGCGKELPTKEPKNERTEKLSPEQEARIKELVKQLGDEDFQTREKATEDLIKIGEAAEELLTKALQDPDPERRTRVARIIQTIEWEDVKIGLADIKSWYDKSPLIFIGKIETIGKSDGVWCGLIASKQTVTYTIENILKGTCKDKTIDVSFLLISGAKYIDDTPRVKPSVFKAGNRHIVFLVHVKNNGGFIDEKDGVVEKPVKGLISEVKRYKIKELIKQLDNDDWETRESAQEELEKIGQLALPALKEALKTGSAEVRMRAKLLIEKIEKRE